MSKLIATASKDGKPVYTNLMGLFMFDSLSDAGLIRVTGVGQENVYFEWTCDMGHTRKGFCKCL